MFSVYSYEELSEDVQKKIRIQTKSTDSAYAKYYQDFLQESLLERLNNHYDFVQVDVKTVSITDEETNISYTIEVTMTSYKLWHIIISIPCLDYDYNKEIKDFDRNFNNILSNIRNDLQELEPDMGQYLQDTYFTEDGKKVKIDIDK